MKKKICIVITSRAQYGRLKSLIQKIETNQTFELQIILAGAAISEKYGNVYLELKKLKIKVNFKIPILIQGDSPSIMAKTTGLGLIEFSTVFENLKPDLVLVRGDRYEIMAPVIAATYQNIPVAHIEGGDVSGSIDDYVRHAVTKLSSIHFTTNQDSYKRVLKLGEEEKYVFNVGSGDVDFIVENKEFISKLPLELFNSELNPKGIGKSINLKKDYIVILQHPVTTEYESGKEQILETINAIKEINMQVIFLWPNLDSGSDEISRELRKFINNNNLENIHFFRHLSPELYLSLINNSKCLVGNSSSGIKESSYLGIPVINIGNRQNGRLKEKNVIDVNYNSFEIKNGIQKQINHGKYQSVQTYGNGNSAEKIISILKDIKLKRIKKITY